MERNLNALNGLTLPDMPTAPDYTVPFELGKKNANGEAISRSRRRAMEKGQYVFRWERPP